MNAYFPNLMQCGTPNLFAEAQHRSSDRNHPRKVCNRVSARQIEQIAPTTTYKNLSEKRVQVGTKSPKLLFGTVLAVKRRQFRCARLKLTLKVLASNDA